MRKKQAITTRLLLCILTIFLAVPAVSRDEATEGPTGLDKLRFLFGKWNITSQQINTQIGTWQDPVKGHTHFTPFLDGAMIQEVSETIWDGKEWMFHTFYSYDRGKELYRIAITDTLNGFMDIYEGSFEDCMLILSNVGTDTYFVDPQGRKIWFKIHWTIKSETRLETIACVRVKENGRWLPYTRAVYTKAQ